MSALQPRDVTTRIPGSRLYFVETDGLQLAVEEFGSGPPLLYAHGLTGSRVQTAQQLAPLAATRRVIVYDQRGHGESTSVTDPAGYDSGRMAGDAAAILDTLGIERAVVGGNSMGAATSLLFALEHPERVETLLLTAVAFTDLPNPAADQMREIGRQVARLGIADYLAQVTVDAWPAAGMSAEAIAARAAGWQHHNAASIATACETVAGWAPVSQLSELSALTFPALVIAWEEDEIHPLMFGRRVAEALPHGVLAVSDLRTYYNDPEAIGRLCASFLENVAK